MTAKEKKSASTHKAKPAPKKAGTLVREAGQRLMARLERKVRGHQKVSASAEDRATSGFED